MISSLTGFTWKQVAILKFKMAAVKVHFWRGTDPHKFCLLLIWPCIKFHAFIIKCTIFSHTRPTIRHEWQTANFKGVYMWTYLSDQVSLEPIGQIIPGHRDYLINEGKAFCERQYLYKKIRSSLTFIKHKVIFSHKSFAIFSHSYFK